MAQMIRRIATNPILKLPYLTAADIKLGAFMKGGPTAGTDNCFMIKASGSSATPKIVGRLQETIDYSVVDTSDMAGTKFKTAPVQICNPYGIMRLEYDQSSTIAATSAFASTSLDVTSLEDNIDGCFVYIVSGTAIGQTNYATASAAGGAGGITLKAAFGTGGAIADTLIKILPRFHELISLNSDGTKLASQAAAGAIKGAIFDTLIERNNDGGQQMDPSKHAALTGLNGLSSLKFWADVAIRDTLTYSVD